jgi:uracil-DNA glycosylase family 4
METTPVPSNWEGDPKVMFIIDANLGAIHDFEQSPIVGVVNTRFMQIVKKYLDDWYITPFVKCRPKNTTYTKKNMGDCSYWIKEEIKRLEPSILVACGSRIDTYVQCDYICKTPVQITNNKKNEKEFEGILAQIKEKLNANRT